LSMYFVQLRIATPTENAPRFASSGASGAGTL